MKLFGYVMYVLAICATAIAVAQIESGGIGLHWVIEKQLCDVCKNNHK